MLFYFFFFTKSKGKYGTVCFPFEEYGPSISQRRVRIYPCTIVGDTRKGRFDPGKPVLFQRFLEPVGRIRTLFLYIRIFVSCFTSYRGISIVSNTRTRCISTDVNRADAKSRANGRGIVRMYLNPESGSDNSLLGREHNQTEVRVGPYDAVIGFTRRGPGGRPDVSFGRQIDNVETTFSVNVHNPYFIRRSTSRVSKSTPIYIRFGTNGQTGSWGYAANIEALFFALSSLHNKRVFIIRALRVTRQNRILFIIVSLSEISHYYINAVTNRVVVFIFRRSTV